MIYIKSDLNNDVKFIHHKPFDEKHGLRKTKEELELDGFFVDALPAETIQEGKVSILKGDYSTKQVWYEYIVAPLTPEEEILELRLQLQSTQEVLDFLLMGGM